MTERRYLDTDPLTGTVTTHVYDHGEDKGYIEQVTDVSAQLEQNKREQNDGTGGWNEDKSFRKVASIPLAIVERWRAEYGVDVFNKDHAPAVRRLLNDPDWRFLRTAEWKF